LQMLQYQYQYEQNEILIKSPKFNLMVLSWISTSFTFFVQTQFIPTNRISTIPSWHSQSTINTFQPFFKNTTKVRIQSIQNNQIPNPLHCIMINQVVTTVGSFFNTSLESVMKLKQAVHMSTRISLR
jgi:hypothetical protein